MNYVEREYWEKLWIHKMRRKEILIPNKSDPMVRLIEKHIPNGTGTEEAFEIGCGPCGYLAYVGIKKNYIINGIDYSSTIDENLIEWLHRKKARVGQIRQADFFKDVLSKRYDFVFSLGFVEHFDNFMKVVRMHDKYVKENGYLVITAPNYRGAINYIWNKLFNPIALGRHNVNSMRPDLWAYALERKGYQIIWKGYFGGFALWDDDPVESRNKVKNFTMKQIRKVIKDNLELKSFRFWAQYCGVVARKKYENGCGE